MDRLAGRTLGPYELQELLGSGGMGAVYRARHRGLNQPRALKLLPPQLALDEQSVGRFRREATIAASLRHPNIVLIHDIGEADGFHYIAMELVDGLSLRQLLARGGPLSLARALPLLDQLAGALDYAHRRGVVHRDLKPANIIVGPDGHVTLVDFGVARAVGGPTLTTTGMTVGTAAYMAPEAIAGAGFAPSVDLYALGVVAYEMLTGQPPFTGSDVPQVMYAHLHTPPPRPRALRADLPQAVEAVLLRQLAKDPSQRYRSAGEFVAALREAQEPAAVAPVGVIVHRRPPRFLLVGAGFTAVVSIALAGALLVRVLGSFIPNLVARQAATATMVPRPTATALPPTATAAPEPTLTPTPSLPPTPTPSPILFQDDFSDRQHGAWTGDPSLVYLQANTLHLLANVPGQFYRTWPENAPTAGDFVYEAAVAKVAGPDDSDHEYGLVFRDKGDRNFYVFWVSGNGFYGFKRYVNDARGGHFEGILFRGPSPAVARGNATNVLKVEAEGTHFKLSVNGQLLAEADDDFSAGGSYGVIAGNGVLHIAVSSLKVTRP